MESGPSGSRRNATVVLVLVLLVGSAAVYFEGRGAGTTGDASSEVSSLQTQLSSLEQANAQLRSQLASQTESTINTSATSAEALYSTHIGSVVTIIGYELLTQNTFFGQVTSVVSVQGSGFVVEYQNSSYIVTNNHVVDGASNITVTFSDGDSYPASVKGTDMYRDLAILETSAPVSEFHPLQFLSAVGLVSVGETVYAIGSPFGLSGSMTVGIVSQVGRTITESTNTQISIPDVIQFSAAINPGNSGGPLLDSNGEVVGITTAAVSSSQGLGFAIPATTLARELSSLISTGTYGLHPVLGLTSTVDLNYQVAKAAGTNVTYGVLVEAVASGGPADKAGVKGGTTTVTVEGQDYKVGGDVIVSLNGVRVVDMDSLASYLEETAVAGQSVQLGIVRAGSLVTVTADLGDQSQ